MLKWLFDWSSPNHSKPTPPKPPDPKPVDPEIAIGRLIEKSTTLDDCVNAYTSTVSGSPLEQLAMSKVKKLARTFSDWLSVYQSVSPASQLGIFAFEQLPLTAHTFSDWEQFYIMSTDDNLRSTLLEKMAAAAHSRAEQVRLYEMAPEGSVKQSILASLKAQAKDLAGWTSLFESTDGDLQRFAANMMIDLTPDDVNELNDLLDHNTINYDSTLKDKVLARIKALKLSYKKWIEVIEDENIGSDAKAIALDKLSNDPELSSQGFDDWKKILDNAEAGSEFERHAATLVIAKAPQDKPKVVEDLLRYDVINDDNDLREKILKALREMTSGSFEDWKELYESSDEDDDVRAIALDKMIETIDSVDRLIEVEETVDDDDQDDDFTKKFYPKAKAVLLTEADCRRITEKYYAEGGMFEAAFRRLLKLATTTRACLELFLSISDEWKTEGDDVNSELQNEAIDRLLEVATPDEAYILYKLAEDDRDGELEERAKAKLGL